MSVVDTEAGTSGGDYAVIKENGGWDFSDEKLLKMNKIGMIVHALQGTLMLVTFLAVERVRVFTRPIYYSYVSYDSATRMFSSATAPAFDWRIGLMQHFSFTCPPQHTHILYTTMLMVILLKSIKILIV
jgi:hypothetical protein